MSDVDVELRVAERLDWLAQNMEAAERWAARIERAAASRLRTEVDTDMVPAWQRRAACRGRDSLFVHDHGVGSSKKPRRNCGACNEALEVCRRCSVQAECLELALRFGTSHQLGVAGGMLPHDRQALLRRRRDEAGVP